MRPHRIEIAGSGTCVPLARLLAAAFERAEPAADLVLHASIGTRGALRALREGAIDVGLVSRTLRPGESEGLRVVPHARVVVVLAAHPSVPDLVLTADDVAAIYEGRRTEWSDGSHVVALQREPGDSSAAAIGTYVPVFRAANESAWREHRFRVLFSDDEMREALLATPGAIGPFDLGAIALEAPSLRPVRIVGAPPFAKDLSVVLPARPHPLAERFAAFVRSPEARALAAEAGYEPLAEGTP
jgi:phosphate transport system substrate-binding protein